MTGTFSFDRRLPNVWIRSSGCGLWMWLVCLPVLGMQRLRLMVMKPWWMQARRKRQDRPNCNEQKKRSRYFFGGPAFAERVSPRPVASGWRPPPSASSQRPRRRHPGEATSPSRPPGRRKRSRTVLPHSRPKVPVLYWPSGRGAGVGAKRAGVPAGGAGGRRPMIDRLVRRETE